MSHIVVIGAGYAGMLAAMRLNGQRKHQVTLVNASDQFVERIRLHQTAAHGYNAEHAISKLVAGTKINFKRAWVSAVRPDQHEIVLGEKGETLKYDRLLYTLGSTTAARTPGVKEYAYTLAGPAEAKRLGAEMSSKPNGRLLVIGGGLTGIEIATELAQKYTGWQTTVVEMGRFGSALSWRGEAYVRDTFRKLNIALVENSRVNRIEQGTAVLSNETNLPFDVCVWAGAFGVSPLARDSGLSVDSVGRIAVDETLRAVSHPHIFAAGDAASAGVRMACATAVPMGGHAANNLMADLNGDSLKPFRFAFAGRCISLGRGNALMQLVKGDDTPIEKMITGRAAGLIKESICWYTFAGIKMEKRLPGSNVYPLRADLSFPTAPQIVRVEA